jgi:uncharacterized protein (DUF4415 family)
MDKRTIPASDEAWDERSLGSDENFVAVADESLAAGVDEAAGTQLISIRMQKSMIEDLKAIALNNGGLGYQTLMKQVIQRFIDCEKRTVWNEFVSQKLKEEAAQESGRTKSRTQRKSA